MCDQVRSLLKGIALACLALIWAAGMCLAEEMAENPLHMQFVYGQSELGRDLVCHRVGQQDAQEAMLLVFGVHGYEDAFDRDGEVLIKIAERLIAHYEQNAEELHTFCLYVIPCANPDGLIEGTTWEGFGRCNANGIDINRDFSSDWSQSFESRNKTGRAPFATAEARAIRDLVMEVKPKYAMDVHGWRERTYGNGKMAQIFAEPFDFEVNRLCGGGMLCAWLNTMTRESMMLELPPEPDLEEYVVRNGDKLIEGVNAWLKLCAETDIY